MGYLIHIAADHRQRQSGVIDHLKAAPDVMVAVRTMAMGDDPIDRRLVFERKPRRDFQRIIIDGRLFRPSIRLVASALRGG